jgi:hypothetical protein
VKAIIATANRNPCPLTPQAKLLTANRRGPVVQNCSVLNRLRRWLRRLERRWIPDAVERERHEGIVRGRLAETPEPRGDAGEQKR